MTHYDARRDTAAAAAAAPVAVLVVNYRTPDLTLQCVRSVLRSVDVRPHVVVVDNASGDDSVERLRDGLANLPDTSLVTLLARDVNDGYTGGNNVAFSFARASESGARWALVLNSDAELDPHCLRLLVEEGERDARVALVNPRIFYGEPRDLLWFGGARHSRFTGRPVHVGLGRDAAHGWTRPADLPFATGCALLVRLAALDALGGPAFDPSLFAYAEDLDLSLRVRDARWRIRYVPDALVWHYEGASHRKPGGGGQARRFYLNTRNVLRVSARHARWYHWPVLAPALAIDVVGRFAAVAARERDWKALGATLRGAWHAMTRGAGPSAQRRGDER